jgi:hypothetical protein
MLNTSEPPTELMVEAQPWSSLLRARKRRARDEAVMIACDAIEPLTDTD